MQTYRYVYLALDSTYVHGQWAPYHTHIRRVAPPYRHFLDIFEVLDHMTDMWIFTTISRAFSSFSEVHEPKSQRELKVCEQEGQWESLL